jgi:hypothetical protein
VPKQAINKTTIKTASCQTIWSTIGATDSSAKHAAYGTTHLSTFKSAIAATITVPKQATI